MNLTNTNGDTLVMLAAYYGHESAVAALIARGADVNRHNNRGQTPLAGAVFKNDTTIIELLLSADADPLAGSPSALETARFFGKGGTRAATVATHPAAAQRERLAATARSDRMAELTHSTTASIQHRPCGARSREVFNVRRDGRWIEVSTAAGMNRRSGYGESTH